MSNLETVHRYPQRVAFRVPAGLPKAVEAAAARQFLSPSAWIRLALLRQLQTEGVRLTVHGNIETLDTGNIATRRMRAAR
jgi:hypothetical protein